MMTGAHLLRWMTYRQRGFFLILAVYLGLLIPTTWGILPDWRKEIWMLAGLPVVTLLIVTAFTFVNVEADLASSESGYPSFLLRLPVPTTTLAAAPIVGLVGWTVAVWAVFDGVYLRAHHLSQDHFLPPVMLLTIAFLLQAILWIPVRYGALRLAWAVIVPAAVAMFGIFARGTGTPESSLLKVFVPVCVASLGFVWGSVFLARTSVSGRGSASVPAAEPSNVGQPPAKAHRPARSFASPEAAQMWLEWRRQGRVLPIAVTIVLTLASLPLLFNHDLTGDPDVRGLLRINVYTNSMSPILFYAPILIATVIGMGARRSEIRGPEGAFHLFHATRPMTGEAFVKAKFRAIRHSAAWTIAITMAFGLLWAMMPAELDGVRRPQLILSLQQWHWQWASAYFFAAFVAIACGWLWRNLVAGAFVDFLVSHKLASIYPLAVVVGCIAFAMSFQQIMITFASRTTGTPLASGIVAAVLLVKMGFAAWYALQLWRLRPSYGPDILAAFLRWALGGAVMASLLAVVAYLLKDSHVFYAYAPFPELVGFWMVPIARPMLMRLSLETGRHR